ncbi:hypothetical protein TRIUR3_07810 [Triticum urartu]|uniref:Uncharacterized protein n=1 Tax=Triticum urartu TaxID=4572 RepID=M7YL07_TRIUA|nr:hypothetical protein TRIUR3_07810 [Triticum urartu]
MAPSETMLESAAYRRMKAENPSDLFLQVARECRSRIPDDPPQTKATVVTDALKKVPAAVATPIAGAGGGEDDSEEKPNKTAELHDEEKESDDKQVIDAVFLVVGFLTRLVKTAAGVSRDAVDEGFKSTHMQDIVTDMIKLENQLPLKLILDVVEHVQDAARAVAAEARFEGLRKCLEGYKLGFNPATFFDDVVRPFCWYYSPFFNKQLPAVDRGMFDGNHEITLLDFLRASVVPAPPGAEKGAAAGGRTSRMPTARELSRSGVRIAPGEDGRATVEFDEASARLQLPALVYDFKLATVARNLLAREYEEQNKPVTRYFQMMNELVDEAADAKILRRAGAVRGGGASGAEVHELVKRIDGYATYPSVYMAMDVQIAKVRRFHDMRMQNFLVRYRPGVIWASSVAAVSLVAIVAARRRG